MKLRAFQWGDGSQRETGLWNVADDGWECALATDLPKELALAFAAAPDLLAACKALAEAVEGGPDNMMDRLQIAYWMARDSIAKSEGK